MPIEVRRPRKGKRLILVQSSAADIQDIVAGNGYDDTLQMGILAIGERPKSNDGKKVTVQEMQAEGNCVLIFVPNLKTCYMLIDKLERIKTTLMERQNVLPLPFKNKETL